MTKTSEYIASIARNEVVEAQTIMLQRCEKAERSCRRQTSCVFALTTALKLLGVAWVPSLRRRRRRRLNDDLLQVVVQGENHKPRDNRSKQRMRKKYQENRMVFFTQSVPLETTVVAEGVTCTTAPFTWLMMAQWLELEELIILGDAMMRRQVLHEPVRLKDFEELVERVTRYAHSHQRRAPRGITKCRIALDLMAEGTDSVMETRLRLSLGQYGLPKPAVNMPVMLQHGRKVFLDIAYADAKVDVEYDGRHHAWQWEDDAQRRLHIEAAGWRYVQVTHESIDTPVGRATVAQVVAQHLEERLGINFLLPDPLPLQLVADHQQQIRQTLGRQSLVQTA